MGFMEEQTNCTRDFLERKAHLSNYKYILWEDKRNYTKWSNKNPIITKSDGCGFLL